MRGRGHCRLPALMIIKEKSLAKKREGGSEKERKVERGKWSVCKRKKGERTQGRKVRVPTGVRGQ